MASIQHTCSGCIPIDASILDVYIQLIGAKDSANTAAERAEHAAEYAIGKSPYIGENGDWWEWDDELGQFVDTMVQAQGQVAVDTEMSTTSTNPVQNRVVTAAVNAKYTKPSTGIPASDIASGVIPDVSQFITASVNNLVNYYLKSETYTKSEVDSLIGSIQGFSYEVVSTLPTASASTMGKIYLVPSADPQTQNVKDEYITLQSGSSYSWEQIGSTAIDLSGYVTTTQLNTALASYTTTANLTTLLAAKQDVISDLATIRSGATAGSTAYQKPSGGIPKTDTDTGVQESLGKADTALQWTPVGSINPPATPSDWATSEELSQLEHEKTDNDFLFNYYYGKNLVNPNAPGVLIGYTVYKGGSGNLVVVENQDFNTTDFIEVDANTAYYYQTRNVASSDTYGKPRFVTFYDAQKNLLDGLNSNNDTTYSFTTPADTKYVRLCVYKISWNAGIELEKGSSATTYEAYYERAEVKEELIPETQTVEGLVSDVAELQNDDEKTKAILKGVAGVDYNLSEGDYAYVKYSDGSIVDRSAVSARDYYMIEVSVKAGYRFNYKLYTVANVAEIAAYDANGNYLSAKSKAGTAAFDSGIYVVEEGTAKLRFSCSESSVRNYGCFVSRLKEEGQVEKVGRLDKSVLPENYPFAGVKLSELTLNASATRNNDGTVSLANGGKAYWATPTVAVAYTISAKFVYSTGLSFSIGKDQAGNSGYGGRIVLRDGNIDYYRNSLDDGTYNHTTHETGISLVDGEEYAILVHRVFNYENANRTITVEITGKYNEHFSIDLAAGPWYGRPFIQANGAASVVKDFCFAMHLDYDLRNAVISVWGHSYVEADSLPGTDKLLSFTNLLGNVFGHDKLFNFGWGGDYAQRCYERILGESRFTRAVKYALIVIGANDTSNTLSTVTGYLTQMAEYLEGIGIMPIFATPPPIPAKTETANQFLADLSDWIKASDYKYVDMRQVFLDANGNVRTSLYLADNTHPTIEGHQLIFNRIKMDCPYLF